MIRKLFLICLTFAALPLFADEPRVPVVIDVTKLDQYNVPQHMNGKGAVMKTGAEPRVILVKKLTIKDQKEIDSRTYQVTVDLLEATECGLPFSGPATVTYCLSNHDRWGVCKIDCTQAKYYERKR